MSVFAATNLPFWGGEATASYKFLLIIHVLCIVVAFGPLFSLKRINSVAINMRGDKGQSIAKVPLILIKGVSLPPLLLGVVTGFLLIFDSAKRYAFDQAWVSATFAFVLILVVVYFLFLIPAQRRLIDSVRNFNKSDLEVDKAIRAANSRVVAITGIVHLIMFILIVLMVWKPGL